MNKNDLNVIFSSAKKEGKDYWETPLEFYNNLNKKWNFTLDPCASDKNHKCEKYFTEEDNGLIQPWDGHTVFVNPPYSQNKLWIKKCFEESFRINTKIVVLVPGRVDTKFFHDYCMKASRIYFIKSRLKFEIDGKPMQHKDKRGIFRDSPAPFPSIVVVFDGAGRRCVGGVIEISQMDNKGIVI